MQQANLRQTSLQGSDLSKANLQGANLQQADLDGAYLQGAIVTQQQLAEASSFKAATLPTQVNGRTYAEQEGSLSVNTFTDPHNASGMGPKILPGIWVQVSCKVYAPAIEAANPDGYWYRIASSPWNNAYYAPANSFMNGDPVGGPYTHNTDFDVPNC